MSIPSGLRAASQPYWIDALIPNVGEAIYGQLLGGGRTYFYTFPASLPGYDFIPEDGNLYLAFNADQQNTTRAVFRELAAILDLRFIETFAANQPNTIALANNFQEFTTGYSYYPSSSFLGSDVFLDRTTSTNLTMRDGTAGPLTLIHELGHALGLKHPFSHIDAGGDGGEPPYLSAAEDSTQWTVMSYVSSPEQYHAAYSPLDIAALQYLYGPSPTARAGDDSYRVDEFAPSFLWDGGGQDVIDASHIDSPVTLYLEPGYWGHVGIKAPSITAAGQVTVNYGSVFEGLRGGSAGDWLDGNDAANDLRGNGGDDLIYGEGGNDLVNGGNGRDTAGFLGVLSSYSLAAAQGGYAVTDTVSGRDGTDTVAEVEMLLFSDRSVDLTMKSGAAGVPAAALKSLEELYVAFFNRIPEASGLRWWIEQLSAGASLTGIADQFYEAGLAFGIYPSGMSNASFVETVYANALGRRPGTPAAPSIGEIGYWESMLVNGSQTKGSMVLQMLRDAHAYEGDAVWGFAAALLDNKAAVADYYAIELGMSLNSSHSNIAFGREVAALISPTDISQGISLIGQFDFA